MTALKIEFCAPEFFTASPKKIKPVDEGTGRIYLMLKDRVVAVAKEAHAEDATRN